MNKYDVAIIGAGPGGYVAALYAAQSGMRTCLIEEDKIGGVCLNYGCIPTKVLATSTKALSLIKKSENFGIKKENVKLDFSLVLKRKEKIVEKLKAGIEFLLKSRKVEIRNGRAVFEDRNLINVNGEKIKANNIIIATGSSPIDIPVAKIDGKSTLSSKDILNISSIPEQIVIIGGGIIGCEFASIFNSFGSEVSIVEMMPNLIPGLDREISKKLSLFFKKRGIVVLTDVKALDIQSEESEKIVVKISNGQQIPCDKVLICVGRRPNVGNMGLERVGIDFDKKGIKVDQTLKTSIDNIYAIGDCIGGSMLAHVASYEGIIASNNIMGKRQTADYRAVPSCIFTDPEIASVGINEEKAKSDGLDVNIARFYFKALGKAHILEDTDGLVKLVSCKKTKRILGVDIMGEAATELIGEATLAIRNGLTVSDLVNTIHAHPTMSEAILEVAHLAQGKPIHSL